MCKVDSAFFEVTDHLDAWTKTLQLDLGIYNVLAICGDERTFNMSVSAMLNRSDNIKLPIAFIPNSESNDICSSFSITSLDRALDYLVKG